MLLELVFKVLLLAGPPLGALIGIYKASAFWPLAFFTFIGTTITVINLRIAAQLSELQEKHLPSIGNTYHIASWILGVLILVFGLRKIHKIRKSHAIANLLKEED